MSKNKIHMADSARILLEKGLITKPCPDETFV